MTLDELLNLEEIEDVNEWRAGVREGVDGLSAGFEARLAELEDKLAEATSKYNETAARNYELLLAATEAPADEPEESEEPDGETAIADLFKED